MPLIEGIGDEVTILVTVIVAVTTIVAAWFSTSVTEQQPYWRDSSPGSRVDPDPPSQESTSSQDGITEAISEIMDIGEGDEEENADNERAPVPSSDPSTANPSPSDESAISQRVNLDELNTHSSTVDTTQQYRPVTEEVIQQTTTMQNLSFECMETSECDAGERSVVERTTNRSSGVDTTDAASDHSDPPWYVEVDRVEDVQSRDQVEDPVVRRRQLPGAQLPEGSSDPVTLVDQSPAASSCQEAIARSHQSSDPLQCSTSESAETQSQGQPQGQTQSQSQRTNAQTDSGVITIKLRFLDESERIVSTNVADTLGNFRRETFFSEIQAGQTVRLISNGQLLTEDSRTLASYGITNQQVIHCQIAQAVSGHDQGGQQHAEATGTGELDLGRYMVPLFACILAFIWYLRFQYRYMFNATSTLSLVAVTGVFVLALLAVWRA